MQLLKDLYSPDFYNRFSDVVSEVLPDFNKKEFSKLIFAGDWKSKELKERMRHTTLVLNNFMPQKFSDAAIAIQEMITALRKQNFTGSSIEFIFFPDYIEMYGINDLRSSIRAMEFVTQFISCEFAVRPFIIKYGPDMISQMQKWSTHKDHHVRRLSSEGIRPRLPWAMALPALKADPSPILPILENLKSDLSEFVRRSVANNLNDISKDNPGIVISIARKWKGISAETDAIIKHGCRTLLKQGHTEVLQYYGLHGNSSIKVGKLRVHTPKVPTGQSLQFSFSINNEADTKKLLRLEYGVYYRKKNGQLSRKVFKISERSINGGEKLEITKNHSFRVITTRVFYPGKHKLSVIINGEERQVAAFELL